MQNNSQCSWVLNYLKKNQKGLTSMRAFCFKRITRLSSIIYNLRQKGYLIHTFKEPNTLIRGTHARYVLLKDEPELFI
ncbi:MAG: hypothetical protein J6S85_05775 [Methanobrevibacter sp.]|nr:hypothetical protein [Methanobrevibacter sp.]